MSGVLTSRHETHETIPSETLRPDHHPSSIRGMHWLTRPSIYQSLSLDLQCRLWVRLSVQNNERTSLLWYETSRCNQRKSTSHHLLQVTCRTIHYAQHTRTAEGLLCVRSGGLEFRSAQYASEHTDTLLQSYHFTRVRHTPSTE